MVIFFFTVANINTFESDSKASHAPAPAPAPPAVGAATEAWISPSLPLTGEIKSCVHQLRLPPTVQRHEFGREINSKLTSGGNVGVAPSSRDVVEDRLHTQQSIHPSI